MFRAEGNFVLNDTCSGASVKDQKANLIYEAGVAYFRSAGNETSGRPVDLCTVSRPGAAIGVFTTAAMQLNGSGVGQPDYDVLHGRAIFERPGPFPAPSTRWSPSRSMPRARPWPSCWARPSCLRTDRVDASKHAEFSVDVTIAEALRVRLARTRRKVDEPRTHLREVATTAGPRAVRDALFLPARARQLHRDLFLGATLRVEVDTPPPAPVLEAVAADTADRQRRRKTWAQNVDRHALCEQARVTMQVACRSDLRAWLGGGPSRNAALGGST